MRRPRILILGFLIFVVALLGIGLFRIQDADPKVSSSAPATSAPEAGFGSGEGLSSSETSPVATVVPVASEERTGDLPEGYIGTASCVECHPQRHETYSHTGHSRSIREIDLESVPHDVQLVHATSKRSYDIFVRSGQLWHREWEHFVETGQPLRDSDPKLQLAELPVAYIMGSGTFAEAYLLRDDRYLLQSPVTWYIADGQYGMAPGYDQPIHRGCNRVIDDECLYCHAGFVSRDHPGQPRILELAIGCERCHGPSEKHVVYHRSTAQTRGEKAAKSRGEKPAQTRGEQEVAITAEEARSLNPADLERSKLESLCAQCHLNGDVVVDADGKSIWDFIPGEELTETRMVYQADYGDVEDPFTDHFDQLRQSKCYQQSTTLTCISCHDPHHGEVDQDLDQLYRDQCLACHADPDCGKPREERVRQEQNRCVRCHMPAAPSTAVHTATTHHRIGIHPSESKSEPSASPSMVTLRRLQPAPSGMSQEQLALCDLLAKAYWLLEQHGDPQKTKGLRATELEQSLRTAFDNLGRNSPRDLSILAQLAQFQSDRAPSEEEFNRHLSRAGQYARQALALPEIGHHARVNALDVLANQQYSSGDYRGAIATYRQLMGLRRWAADPYNLGLSLGKQRQYELAEQAFRDAIRIDASYPLPYQSLSILYRSIDPNASRQMASIAQDLLQNTRSMMAMESESARQSESPADDVDEPGR